MMPAVIAMSDYIGGIAVGAGSVLILFCIAGLMARATAANGSQGEGGES